jgi:hypothetical protein
MLIRGKCHCGNISFSLTWDPDPKVIPARACDCTFCQKHGGVWTSNPRGALEVAIDDPSRVSRYAFGSETAQFHICARCGIVPVVTSRIDVDPALLERAPISFEAEQADTRLARRKRNWIPDVAIK